MKKKKRFIAKRVTKISDIAKLVESGEEAFIEESDLSLQDDKYLVQFDLEDEAKNKRDKYIIEPGTFNIAKNMSGIYLTELELRKQDLLKTNDNTESILSEVGKFFNNLETYKEFGIDPRRALLMYGPPGVGKTASITEACNGLSATDKGTVIINWNASSIAASDVLDFFTSGSEYSDKCTKLIIVIEDIGMSVEGYGGPKEIDRALLNLLDGSGVSFRVPTYIMATTNYAHNLPENLVNRPGRFDKVMKVGYPKAGDRVNLLEHIMKVELSKEDKDVIASKDCDDMSAAHMKEIFIRSKLDQTSIKEVVRQLKKHSKDVEKGFSNTGSTGLL